MGIKNFQQYIKDVYGDACQRSWPQITYDNLYIDLNHVLHHVCYLSKDLVELRQRFMDSLCNIICQVKPKKRVYLVADGPAPLAKMLVQRKRRLDTVKTANDKDEIKQNLSLNLTPGTEFMNGLESSMQTFIAYIEKKFNINVHVSIIDAGEGEIKIRKMINQVQKKNPDDTHIVFSSDSDVVLLLFSCNHISKIYQMIQKDVIIHFGTMLDIHRKRFGKTDSDQLDFVFINLLMGNDYLPKASYFKLEHIWDAYKLVARSRPKGLIIMQNDTITFDYMFFLKLVVLGTKKSPQHLINRFNISDLKDLCYKNYSNGLYWCFNMYISGICSNYLYQYDHSTSPHIMGVALSLMKNNTYNIIYSDSIDTLLYGILLIPECANTLLSKEQNMIATKLVVKHNVIYEEGRCARCKKFSSSAGKLNIQIKSYDSDTEERHELAKKITTLNKQFTLHRATHEKLSTTKIIEIAKDFNEIREELMETVSLEDDQPEEQTHIIYVPSHVRRKTNVKSMFRKNVVVK